MYMKSRRFKKNSKRLKKKRGGGYFSIPSFFRKDQPITSNKQQSNNTGVDQPATSNESQSNNTEMDQPATPNELQSNNTGVDQPATSNESQSNNTEMDQSATSNELQSNNTGVDQPKTIDYYRELYKKDCSGLNKYKNVFTCRRYQKEANQIEKERVEDLHNSNEYKPDPRPSKFNPMNWSLFKTPRGGRKKSRKHKHKQRKTIKQ